MERREGRPRKILRIRELRVARGLSQGKLAEALGVGQSVLSMWEAETVLPRTRDLPRLAAVLGCSIDDLYIKEDPEDEAVGA